MPKSAKTVTVKVGTSQPSLTPLEIVVAVKRAQKEARDRILKENGLHRSDWGTLQADALMSMGNDRERIVGGYKVQIVDTPRYLAKKPNDPMFYEQSLIVSEAV